MLAQNGDDYNEYMLAEKAIIESLEDEQNFAQTRNHSESDSGSESYSESLSDSDSDNADFSLMQLA